MDANKLIEQLEECRAKFSQNVKIKFDLFGNKLKLDDVLIVENKIVLYLHNDEPLNLE